jgi:predicted component of type VI protein secretion system
MLDTLGVGTFTQNGDNIINLLDFSNYYKHVNNSTPLTLTGDLTIRINDGVINWKNGQRFRLSFGDKIYPGSYIIRVLTNSLGKYPISNPTTSPYSTTIISFDDDIFASHEYEPVFDIVCIDANNLKFQVDVIGKSLTNNQ